MQVSLFAVCAIVLCSLILVFVATLIAETIESRQQENRARAAGARLRWVTREGYTQLPPKMLADVASGDERRVWFLKRHGRWEAWPEVELDWALAAAADAPAPQTRGNDESPPPDEPGRA